MTGVTQKKYTWAVIGGGNGGQSAAGHLGTMGYDVRLYDVIPETVTAIAEAGGIHLGGAVEGFGPVSRASTDMSVVIDGADVIMVIAPAIYHRAIAEKMAQCISPGQLVFVHPGATLGAVEFRQVFRQAGLDVDKMVIAEAQSLMYACRVSEPGRATINGMKNSLAVAAVPASKTEEAVAKIADAFPRMHAASNVFETSLTNLNAIMHPAPSLLNVSLIESGRDWEYYRDGITPTIGRFLEAMDTERVALGKALGLDLKDVKELYKEFYSAEAETLSEIVRNVDAYRGIAGQKRIDTRYVLEDIPTGLVPMVSLSAQLGLNAEMMETTCRLGSYLIGRDLVSTGRTMENLGINGLSAEELVATIVG
ncbi:MAG: NAD/NADP octopine/nopaline dehydrogenase family protein [Spirochaeta sp.]|nr:NAD/NADP octopine/nopaline dehydrogenase family protein [Spirochaeta sp.]